MIYKEMTWMACSDRQTDRQFCRLVYLIALPDCLATSWLWVASAVFVISYLYSCLIGASGLL